MDIQASVVKQILMTVLMSDVKIVCRAWTYWTITHVFVLKNILAGIVKQILTTV